MEGKNLMAATKADNINCSMEWVIARDNNYCYGEAKCRMRREHTKKKHGKRIKAWEKETKSDIRTGLLFKGEENAI